MDAKVKVSALIPALIGLTNYILSPSFYGLLPDKWSHLIYAAAIILGLLFPKLVNKNVAQSSETPTEK